MTMESNFWVTVGDIEVGLLALSGLVFLTTYTLLARWWKTREGKFIFTASLWLTVLFSYIYAARVGWLSSLEDGGARVWLRLAIFTPFAVGLIWISVLLLLAQREQWHRRKEK